MSDEDFVNLQMLSANNAESSGIVNNFYTALKLICIIDMGEQLIILL